MKSTEAIIAVGPGHQAAGTAVKRPAQAGLEMMNVSVLGKGYHSEEEVGGFYNSGDRIRLWAPRARQPANHCSVFEAAPESAVHGRG
jgi:hypothetical protein